MNKTQLIKDARSGMSLKWVPADESKNVSSAHGLNKWRKVTKINSSGLFFGQCKLALPSTEFIRYDRKRLIIYHADEADPSKPSTRIKTMYDVWIN